MNNPTWAYMIAVFVMGHVSMYVMMRIRGQLRRMRGLVDAEVVRMLREKRERRVRDQRIALHSMKETGGSATNREVAPIGAAKSRSGVLEPTARHSLRAVR